MTTRQVRQPAKLVVALMAFICAWCLVLNTSEGVASPDDQEQVLIRVKSAFLLNFVKYTQWPESAFEDEGSEIIVSLVGEDTLGPTLDQTMANRKQHDRSIRINRIEMPDREAYESDRAYQAALEVTGQTLSNSHLVYYTGANARVLQWLAQTVQTGTTLTVGEGADAVEEGMMLGFVVERRKLRFRAGFEAIEASSVDVNPRLLGLAQNKPGGRN